MYLEYDCSIGTETLYSQIPESKLMRHYDIGNVLESVS